METWNERKEKLERGKNGRTEWGESEGVLTRCRVLAKRCSKLELSHANMKAQLHDLTQEFKKRFPGSRPYSHSNDCNCNYCPPSFWGNFAAPYSRLLHSLGPAVLLTHISSGEIRFCLRICGTVVESLSIVRCAPKCKRFYTSIPLGESYPAFPSFPDLRARLLSFESQLTTRIPSFNSSHHTAFLTTRSRTTCGDFGRGGRGSLFSNLGLLGPIPSSNFDGLYVFNAKPNLAHSC